MRAPLHATLLFPALAALAAAALVAGARAAAAAPMVNARPVIGVLTQPLSDANSSEILVASYVKWVESAGARAVPLRYTDSNETLDGVLAGVNGVVFPGGNVAIRGTRFAAAAAHVLRRALEANAAGEVFPVWATCLGFEQMMLYSSSPKAAAPVLARVDAEDVYVPLAWVGGRANATSGSTLLAGAPADVLDTLGGRNVTINMHEWGVLYDDWAAGRFPALARQFRALATSLDRRGARFVALVEHAAGWPVFGSQFHPEKTAYEWSQGHPDYVHTSAAVASMQFMADRLVGFARRSPRAFASPAALQPHLIYNWPAAFTGRPDARMVEQIYFFSVAA